MYEHIIPLADELAAIPVTPQVSNDISRRAKELKQFLATVEVERFPIAIRVELQRKLKELEQVGSSGWQGKDLPKLKEISGSLADLLRTETGGTAAKRTFPGIADSALRQIIERDYDELVRKLLPSSAVKSSIILAGSILEGILRDALYTDQATKARARASSRAPRTNTGGLVPMNKWNLAWMIDVATDLGILDSRRESLVDVSLRDYRNFVHPAVKLLHPYPIDDTEMKAADAALSAVIKHMRL